MPNVIILGSGPAGCTAALYLGRAGFRTQVFEGSQPGGQLIITDDVENFPGFPEGIGGMEIVSRMKRQAEKFGVEFILDAAEDLDPGPDPLRVKCCDGWRETDAIVVATGASARWLGARNEVDFRGRGVSACATCDGAFFRGKPVAIVGGGDSALTEALFLSRFASRVTLIHRRQGFRGARINQERVRKNPKIDLLLDTVVEAVKGEGRVQALGIRNVKTGETSDFPVDGLFIAVGHDPNTGFLKGKVAMDEKGYLVTFEGTATNVPGVFAAGDVADPTYQQAVTAAGMGCQAALDVERYCRERGI